MMKCISRLLRSLTVLCMLQAMKAHAQKKFASKAANQGVIDIHAQEGQALTSSLSGTALWPGLPCHSDCHCYLAASVDASCILSNDCCSVSALAMPMHQSALQCQLMALYKLRLVLHFAILRHAVLLSAAAYAAKHYKQHCLCFCRHLSNVVVRKLSPVSMVVRASSAITLSSQPLACHLKTPSTSEPCGC